MRRALAAAAVAVLLASAGCGEAAGDATPTRTPFGYEDATPTPEPEPVEFAPGLTDRGVVNASAMARAHGEALGNASFRRRYVHAVRSTDGTTVARTERITVVGSNGSIRRTVRALGDDQNDVGVPSVNLSVWTNGSVTAVRTRNADGTDYALLEGRARVPIDLAGTRRIERLFVRADVRSIERVPVDDRRAYRVSATVWPGDTSTVSNRSLFRLTATIGPGGLVSRLVFSYPFVHDGQRLYRHQIWTVDPRANVTVTRPPWYEAAAEGQRRTTVAGGDDPTAGTGSVAGRSRSGALGAGADPLAP